MQSSANHSGVGGTTYNSAYRVSGIATSVYGMRICKAGAFYGTSCGSVTGLNVTGPTGVTDMGEASYYGGHGDSGAPVFAGNLVYGLHESHNSPSSDASSDCFYVGITGATHMLGVSILTF